MEEEKEELDLRTPEVLDKYRTAAEIANRALATVVSEATPGKKIVDLCALGDKIINDGVAAVYNKGKIEKGVAFPTCISVDNCVGHFSPLKDDETVLQEGALVKVDLGAHIDGFIATGAHSFIATTATEAISGKKADVICAAHFAAECALRLFRPGNTNAQITEAIQKVAESFKCNAVEGVLSHQMRRFVIDGNNVVINKETLEQKVDAVTFEEYDVYCFDIVMSTGEGKAKETEVRPTVFKRAVEQNYLLKMKASRALFSEINKKFPTMPFSLRALEDERRAKLGITECLKHELLETYPVLYEKEGEYVAQFKFTALLLPNQTMRLISHPLPFVKSDFTIEDNATKALLNQGTKRSKKKKRAKKKAQGGDQAQEASMDTSAQE
ncbi:Proliferation-associated protein 2G4 [Balamuthia mandrillaris]